MTILLGVTLVTLLGVVVLVLPVVSWIRSATTAAEIRQLRARFAALEQQVRELTTRTEPPAEAPAPAAAPTPVAPAPPVRTTGPVEERVEPVHKVAQPAPVTAAPVLPPGPDIPPTAGSPGPDRGWIEAAIGGRVLLYAGSLTVILGLGFFLKYAFDRNWITEWMRVAIGAIAGVGLIAVGLRLARIGYAGYGQVLGGVGLVALYLSVYAAFSFYDLIGRASAFTLFVVITVAAAWLSDRQRSAGMAVMAVGGGFLAPVLVGSNTDAQLTLFSYVALLVTGTVYLARRRHWPLLNIVSYGATLLTVAAWAASITHPRSICARRCS